MIKIFIRAHICMAITMLLILGISACESTTVPKYEIAQLYKGRHIEVMIIDSCEYIIVSSDVRAITHKGNCKFCAQRASRITSGSEKKQSIDAPDTIPIIRYKHPYDGGLVYVTNNDLATFKSFSFRDSNVAIVSGRDTMDFEYSLHQEFKRLRIDIMFAMNYYSLVSASEDTLISTDGIVYVKNKSTRKKVKK